MEHAELGLHSVGRRLCEHAVAICQCSDITTEKTDCAGRRIDDIETDAAED